MKSPDARTVFDFLDEVRERPGMFFGPDRPLHDVAGLIWGYHACLRIHGILEDAPSMAKPFGAWVKHRNPAWSMSCGWWAALAAHSEVKGYAMLDEFFALLDEYRQLQPTVMRDVTLQSHHQPTGRRVTYGHGSRMARPNRVQVLHYKPSPLHVLRSFYERGTEERVLTREDGSLLTTVEEAEAWLTDELQLGPDWP